jgi:integrase
MVAVNFDVSAKNKFGKIMPIEATMTWNKTNGRWYKKHQGKQLCVTAGKLKKLYPDLVTGLSESGSMRAANTWLKDKLSELKKEPPPANPDQPTIDRLSEVATFLSEQGEHDQAYLVNEQIDKVSEWRRMFPNTDQPANVLASVAVTEAEMLRTKANAKVSDELNLAANVQRWLDHKFLSVRTEKTVERKGVKTITAGHWENLRHEIEEFMNWHGPDKSVKEFSGKHFIAWHDLLVKKLNDGDYSESHAKQLQGTCKTFFLFLLDSEILPALPAAMRNRSFNFEVETKTIEPWTKADVHFALKHANDRMRLFILLCLNCGMYQSDIASLKFSEVDFKTGIITRARKKTREKSKFVPIISWQLWPETFRLLKEFKSTHATFVLLNEKGLPLKTEKIRGNDDPKAGKFAKTDNIASTYNRLKKKHPDQKWKLLMELRKTGPSLFRESPEFTSIRDLYLGHTDKDLADRAYAEAPMKLLARAVSWLRTELDISGAMKL